jgi:methyl-accepting chemotaxis protein
METTHPLLRDRSEAPLIANLVSTMARRRSLSRSLVDASLGDVMAEFAEISVQVGVEVADIAGSIENLSAVVRDQAVLSGQLRSATEDISEGNHQVGRAVVQAHAATKIAHDEATGSREAAQTSLAELSDLMEWVGNIGREYAQVAEALAAITTATSQIGRIAQQTHILALNARIEAARAGASGQGFQIIANSVRDLAAQTVTAADEINATVQPLSLQIGHLTEQGKQAQVGAETMRKCTQSISSMIDAVTDALANADDQVADIEGVATIIRTQVDGFLKSLSQLADGLEHSSLELGGARERATNMLGLSERLVATSARTGVRTLDTPLIEAAVEAAAKVSALFSAAVDQGEISMADLFDENYRLVPGSNPAQYLTAFSSFTDQVLPAIQEPILDVDPRIAFGISTDRNGYIATHMKKVSEPQGPDPVWNAANCRNRRIFNDRTGLTCGRNIEPFILQTYRRDMGGGKFVMMKDVSAPIWVHGEHWGGFRIGYAAA